MCVKHVAHGTHAELADGGHMRVVDGQRVEFILVDELVTFLHLQMKVLFHLLPKITRFKQITELIEKRRLKEVSNVHKKS